MKYFIFAIAIMAFAMVNDISTNRLATTARMVAHLKLLNDVVNITTGKSLSTQRRHILQPPTVPNSRVMVTKKSEQNKDLEILLLNLISKRYEKIQRLSERTWRFVVFFRRVFKGGVHTSLQDPARIDTQVKRTVRSYLAADVPAAVNALHSKNTQRRHITSLKRPLKTGKSKQSKYVL